MRTVLFLVLILQAALALSLDMGTASDGCVGAANCTEANVVQALLLTQDLAVYFACAVALFFGFSLGLRMFPK